MDPDTLEQISRQVVRSHPQMAGVKPTVRRQPRGESGGYLITYRTSSALPGGKILTMIVRVVADERGRIVKMTTSR